MPIVSRRIPRLLVLAVALAALPALAAQPPIQQQMTQDEFHAAGLDKLSPDELARLNTWLGRRIEAETERAATNAKQLVVEQNRGFFHFGSSEPIRTTLPGTFTGFLKGRSYTFANGQVWKQSDDASLAGVRLTDPTVVITPGRVGNVWYMKVGKYNTAAQVQRVK